MGPLLPQHRMNAPDRPALRLTDFGHGGYCKVAPARPCFLQAARTGEFVAGAARVMVS
jgi:hypothetical protein